MFSKEETSAALTAPSSRPPGLPHSPWELWCCDSSRVHWSHWVAFSWGSGSLFQLWLGHPALPALSCLPLVLPVAWTVVLCCGWLLLSTDALLKHCCLPPTSFAFALGWISWWYPGPGSPCQVLSVVPRSDPATANLHHWPGCVYSVSQNP